MSIQTISTLLTSQARQLLFFFERPGMVVLPSSANILDFRFEKRVALGNNVFITVKTVDDDSLCLIETPHYTYLNVNDCVASDVEALHRYISSKFGRIDVLLTQFSFASWAGNPGDAATVRYYANEKLQQIETQLAIYKPRTLIPFASFVWFCCRRRAA